MIATILALMPTTRSATRKVPQSEATQTVTPEIVIPTIDEIVHDQALYVKICDEQSVVFRQNVEEFTKEYALYSQSADVVKPGQNWKPSPGDRDAFVAEMKRRCQEVPKSIADRVKIYCAAHAILACTVFVDATRHTRAAQLEILAKSNKKCQENLMPLPTTQTLPLVKPLTRSIPNPRQRPLTAEDCTLFAGNPATLPGKQFLLEEDGGRDSLYEVTEVKLLKGRSEYLVQFEGCCDCVTVSDQGMMVLLKRSSLVEST